MLAAIQDHDLVINQHSGQGSPDYGQGPVPEALWISEVTFYCQAGFRHLLMSGAFEKYPRLKYIITESGCAWAGPLLRQLDRIHMGFKAGAIGEMNYEGMEWVLKDLPSEYAARNCWYGASFPSNDDLAGIESVGEDRVLWGNDYPHYEGTFPYNLESLRLTFAGMEDGRRRKTAGIECSRPVPVRCGKTDAAGSRSRSDAGSRSTNRCRGIRSPVIHTAISSRTRCTESEYVHALKTSASSTP